jgi:hypothetical protein
VHPAGRRPDCHCGVLRCGGALGHWPLQTCSDRSRFKHPALTHGRAWSRPASRRRVLRQNGPMAVESWGANRIERLPEEVASFAPVGRSELGT